MIRLDLVDPDWHRLSEAGSSNGSLYKAAKIIDGAAHFYKMSMIIGRKTVGHEAANEVIVSRLLDVLDISHIHYDLCRAKVRVKGEIFDTFVCESVDYKAPGIDSIPFELYCQLCGSGKDPFTVATQLSSSSYVDQMFVVDFLIANRDRHGYNLEVYQSDDKLTLAPLFDMGYSLTAPLQNDINLVRAFDPMQDVAANNFIGSESLFENLKLIRHPVQVSPLSPLDKKRIFRDISLVVSKDHIAKMWDIIWTRYQYLIGNGYLKIDTAAETSYFGGE